MSLIVNMGGDFVYEVLVLSTSVRDTGLGSDRSDVEATDLDLYAAEDLAASPCRLIFDV